MRGGGGGQNGTKTKSLPLVGGTLIINIILVTNFCLMSGHHLRRWPDFKLVYEDPEFYKRDRDLVELPFINNLKK